MDSGLVLDFYERSRGINHRFKSWEHCYSYYGNEPRSDMEKAALHLDSYLASWGMKRGSTRLLQRDYLVHNDIILSISDKKYAHLRGISFKDARECVQDIFELFEIIRNKYRRHLSNGIGDTYNPSDTLITKVLLGTLACIPAYDRFFRKGLARAGLPWSTFSQQSFLMLLDSCERHSEEVEDVSKEIERRGGLKFPPMKIVDMYFWVLGEQMLA